MREYYKDVWYEQYLENTACVAVFVKEVGGLTKMSSPLSEDDSEVADRSPRCRCREWGLAALTLDKIFW